MPPLFDGDQPTTRPQPAGQPGYQRQSTDWWFGYWTYSGSRAIHGRLVGPAGEVFGQNDGDTVEADFGTLVWRGDYVPDRASERSTGWLFVWAYSGPPCIRDRYDPATGTLGPMPPPS